MNVSNTNIQETRCFICETYVAEKNAAIHWKKEPPYLVPHLFHERCMKKWHMESSEQQCPHCSEAMTNENTSLRSLKQIKGAKKRPFDDLEAFAFLRNDPSLTMYEREELMSRWHESVTKRRDIQRDKDKLAFIVQDLTTRPSYTVGIALQSIGMDTILFTRLFQVITGDFVSPDLLRQKQQLEGQLPIKESQEKVFSRQLMEDIEALRRRRDHLQEDGSPRRR